MKPYATALFFLLFSSHLQAGNTPPSQQNICESVEYATKGLYGLCVAYCEAQDGPTEIEPGADLDTLDLPIPSRRILTNYDRKREEWDPKMPCVNYDTNCPVWSPEELAAIGSLSGSHSNYVEIGADGDYEYYEERDIAPPPSGARIEAYLRGEDLNSSSPTYWGRYLFMPGDASPGTVRDFWLTRSEFETCKQQLLDH